MPPPPDPATIDPLYATIPTGKALVRCFDGAYGPIDFYAGTPGNPGRFHPLLAGGTGDPVGVLYASDSVDGALAEVIFRDVPAAGPNRQVSKALLAYRYIGYIETRRDLKVVDLTSHGLTRLGITRRALIESGPMTYAETAAWAGALHDHAPDIDGMVWVSRLHDRSKVVVLFGDRVRPSDLVASTAPLPFPLAFGNGLERVREVAERCGITVVEPGGD